MKVTDPVLVSMPDDVYHADPVEGGSLSQSGAKLLLEPSCPALFRHRMDNPPPTKKVYEFGHAAHALVLGTGRQPVEVPASLLSVDGGIRSKDAKMWVAEQRLAGNTPMKADEIAAVKAMAEKILAHPVASKLFTAGTPEQAMFWPDQRSGVTMRGKLDWLPDAGGGRRIIPDYKTAVSAAPDKFAKAMWDLSYYIQAAWYLWGIEATLDDPDAAFLFVVQEKSAPYLVNVFQPDANALKIGRMRARRALILYAECVDTGVWPGYSDGIETASLPYWAENQFL